MRRVLLVLGFVLLMTAVSEAQVFSVPVKAPPINEAVAVPVADTSTLSIRSTVVEKSVGDGTEGSRRLNLRERTALGYTYKNVARVRGELKDSGFITSDTPESEVSLMIQGIILSEADPQVRAEIIGTTSQQVAEIDWDNLSRIIEMILEFLSKILPMFLSPAPVG